MRGDFVYEALLKELLDRRDNCSDENYLKYINKILKAFKKTKKYTDLLTY